jgi:hypothetical protein
LIAETRLDRVQDPRSFGGPEGRSKALTLSTKVHAGPLHALVRQLCCQQRGKLRAPKRLLSQTTKNTIERNQRNLARRSNLYPDGLTTAAVVNEASPR